MIFYRRWFEENAQNETVKNIVRLLRDLKSRFEGLAVLSPWMIDLLVYFSARNFYLLYFRID